MPDIQREINERIEAFVTDISELAKKFVLETVESGLTSSRRSPIKGLMGGTPRVRRKSGKRSPDEIQDAATTLLDYIRENPGRRMEEIAKALGSTTKDLTLPIKKLQQQNMIKVEGQKRATCYYPSTGKSVKAKQRKVGGRRKKA